LDDDIAVGYRYEAADEPDVRCSGIRRRAGEREPRRPVGAGWAAVNGTHEITIPECRRATVDEEHGEEPTDH